MQELGSLTLLRLLIVMQAELAAVETRLNSLNVFPVPDGDTGTNLRVTLDAALAAVIQPASDVDEPNSHQRREPATDVRDRVLRALTVGAQGNSGVILAQYIRGFIEGSGWGTNSDVIDRGALVQGLVVAAQHARQAVDMPVEGTILSVAQESARAAQESFDAAGSLADIATAATDAATRETLRTRDTLPQLTHAGVIDAGAAGLTIVLECLRRVTAGRHSLPASSAREWLRAPYGPLVSDGACHVNPGGTAFEFMAVVDDLSSADADELRRQLGQLGDSVVVAGGSGTYRVHIHTDDVLAAATAVRTSGRMSAPSVTRFEGPVVGLESTCVVTQDPLLRALAVALGARDEIPQPGPQRDAVEALLVDSTIDIPAELQDRVQGVRSSLHVALELEARCFDAQWGHDSAEEPLPVYRAMTWADAVQLVRGHFSSAELIYVAVNAQASTSEVDRFRDALPKGAQVSLTRLESEFLVQLAGE